MTGGADGLQERSVGRSRAVEHRAVRSSAKFQSDDRVRRQHHRYGLVRPRTDRLEFRRAHFDGFIRNSLAAGGNAHFTGPGPGNALILGSFFGLAANPANSPGGTNYAIGGAFDGPTLGPGFQNLFSTTYGVANPNLPGTAAQIGNYLASVNGRANPNALYLISSGGNDAFYASSTFGSNAAAANVFLLSEAQALVAAGAQLQ
jgi:outer membrane lipase/esterase